jgi:hypothetical protein
VAAADALREAFTPVANSNPELHARARFYAILAYDAARAALEKS